MANDRFLLIKAWSYILWADVEHVMSQLLIAELTGRTPVVYWPTHCLHNGYIHTNGFELYFEPVSESTIFDLAKPEYTFYPPVWDSDNLLADDPSRDTWIYRNIGETMTCRANVLVGDVYYDIYNLIPFIKKDHPAYGMTVRQIYRYLFQKYIRVRPDIKIEIEGFYNSWLRDNKPALAVHILKPYSDPIFLKSGSKTEYRYYSKSYRKKKAMEKIEKKVKFSRLPWKRKTLKPNAAYHDEIRKLIEKYNIGKIFLLTNSEAVLKEYRQRYGDMIAATECRRLTDKGDSYLESPMVKRRRGIEVLKDTYVAAKCEFFLGNDFSSVSQAVINMKDWPDTNAKLLYRQIGKRKYPIHQSVVMPDKKHRPFRGISRFFHGFSQKRLKHERR